MSADSPSAEEEHGTQDSQDQHPAPWPDATWQHASPPPPPPGTAGRQHAWRVPQSPGDPGGPQGPGTPGGSGGPFSEASRWPPGRGASPVRRRLGSRSLMWLAVAAAVVALLVHTNRISSTDVILFCILVPSVILHEISHGAVALLFGDDTAKRAGRLSLNPLRHVTVWGTIVVPAVTLLAGFGYFGWAKPVPVDVRRLRSPRNHGVLVALAGPLTNVLIAAVLGVLFYVAFAAGRVGPVPASLAARVVFFAGVVNLWVAVFNLIPIPPLDGSALLERLLPAAWWPGYLRLRSYGLLIVVGGLVLLSMARVYPLQSIFVHIDIWWGHVVHAF